MSIMITGGTGFLGSYLARHLIQEKGETDMVLFDMHPTVSRVSDIQDRITIVQGDVLEPHELLATMARYNVDRVFHLAYILGGPANEKAVIFESSVHGYGQRLRGMPHTWSQSCGVCQLCGGVWRHPQPRSGSY